MKPINLIVIILAVSSYIYATPLESIDILPSMISSQSSVELNSHIKLTKDKKILSPTVDSIEYCHKNRTLYKRYTKYKDKKR